MELPLYCNNNKSVTYIFKTNYLERPTAITIIIFVIYKID